MAKAKAAHGAKASRATAVTSPPIPAWRIKVDYVETCNCDFGCPCNFNGYPTNGFCEALVAYHIREGRFGRVKLDGVDVVYAAAWPNAIHQGGGTLRLFVAEQATAEQRDAVVRIFSGRAAGSGPFALFAGTLPHVEEPAFVSIELKIDGRQSAFRIPGVCDVALAPHTDPVSGAVQDVRLNLPKGFIFRTAQAARTLVMKLLGTGPLSFDHSGQNAFYARVEFQGP
jgi:hypothetical protein